MSKVAALPRPGQRPDETALAGPAAVRADRRGGAEREAGAAKKKVLIDADPGTDDALALIAALNSPEMDVLGVTTVGGNASLADTTRNALRLLDHLGSDLPVSRGSARPLRGRFEYAYHFHGAAGLGVRLPGPRTAATAVGAVERIVGAASEYRGALTLIALGPLTNVARAMRSNPRLAGWIAEVVVMGGAVEVPGNVTPHAEFNVYNDPEAAHEVLTSGTPVRLIGLDVTMKLRLDRAGKPWAAGGSVSAKLANRVLAGWFETHPGDSLYHLHDPLAVAAVVEPDLLGYGSARMAVETEDTGRRGKTSAVYGDGPARVAVEVDAGRAGEWVRARLSA